MSSVKALTRIKEMYVGTVSSLLHKLVYFFRKEDLQYKRKVLWLKYTAHQNLLNFMISYIRLFKNTWK